MESLVVSRILGMSTGLEIHEMMGWFCRTVD